MKIKPPVDKKDFHGHSREEYKRRLRMIDPYMQDDSDDESVFKTNKIMNTIYLALAFVILVIFGVQYY